jgi:hypothetical protein
MDGFQGLYRATVMDIQDPSELRRVRVKVMPMMDGIREKSSFPWAVNKDPRFVDIPDVGANVWVEFEGGDIMKPVYSGFICDKDGKTVPDEAKDGYPFTKTFKLPNGVLINIDTQGNILIANNKKEITISCDKILLSAKSINIGSSLGYIVTCPQKGQTIQTDTHTLFSSESVKA